MLICYILTSSFTAKESPCEILPTFIQSWNADIILKKQDILKFEVHL